MSARPVMSSVFLAEWVHDTQLRRLPRYAQMLLIFLRSLCDRHGKFECDPKELHRLLYVGVEDNVSARDVATWLDILRAWGFIKSGSGVEGRQVGEISRRYWCQTPEAGEPPPSPPLRSEEKSSEVNARAARGGTHVRLISPSENQAKRAAFSARGCE